MLLEDNVNSIWLVVTSIAVITTSCVSVDVFPQASVCVHVTVVVPIAVIGNVTSATGVVEPSQLSVPGGGVNVTSHKLFTVDVPPFGRRVLREFDGGVLPQVVAQWQILSLGQLEREARY